MECKIYESSENAITRPKNIWTLKEAEEYLSSVLGDVNLVSPEKVEESVVSIKKCELSVEEKLSLTALNKYVGIAHLDEDNTVKALEFFRRSIQCYDSFIPNVDSEEIEDLKNEALIYLNLCHLRNYDQLHEVAQFLSENTFKKLKPSNGALLFLAITELKELHDEETVKDFNLDTEDFEGTTLYRALATCESLVSYYGHEDEDFEEECQHYDLGKNEQLVVAKMLIRSVVLDPEIFLKCSSLIRENCKSRGIKNSCSLANVHLAKGMHYLEEESIDKERAEECFKSCLEIRRSQLGENHAKTAAVKFELGSLRFVQFLCPGSLIQPENYQLMKEALCSLKQHSNGCFPKCRLYAEFLAELLQANGVLQISIDIYKESAELNQRNKTPIFNDSFHIYGLWTRIGEIYLAFKKYKLALSWFLNVNKNMEDETDEETSDAWTKSVVGSGYCYFKLEDYISARKFFDFSEWFLHFPRSMSSTWDSMTYRLFECEFLFSCEPGVHGRVSLQSILFSLPSILESVGLTCSVWNRTQILRLDFQLGCTYKTIVNSLERAERYYLDVPKICGEETIYHHPVLCDACLGLARIYLNQKKITDCEKYAKKCLELSILLFGSDGGNVEPVVEIFGQLVDHRKNIRKANTVLSSYLT